MADAPATFGIYLPQVGFTYPEILERARRIERHGFESLWFFDHLYTPGLPEQPAFEGWTLVSALAEATSTIRLGHMVLCNSFRHPALLGKMATTLDVISGGRLNLGLGSGSAEPEHHQAGLGWPPLAERSERLGEALEILTRMFSGQPTTFRGRYYQVEDLPNVPGPVQVPRPPIIVGGASPRYTLPLVARYADVWNVPTYALERLDRAVDDLHRACDVAGRDPSTLRWSLEAVLALAPDEAHADEVAARARRRYGGPGFGLEAGGFSGTAGQVAARIDELRQRGFSDFVFFTWDRGEDETLACFSEEVLPLFAGPRP